MSKKIVIEDLEECFRILYDETSSETIESLEKELGFGDSDFILFRNEFFETKQVESTENGVLVSSKIARLTIEEFKLAEPYDYE